MRSIDVKKIKLCDYIPSCQSASLTYLLPLYHIRDKSQGRLRDRPFILNFIFYRFLNGARDNVCQPAGKS